MSRIAKDQEAKWQEIEARNYAGQSKYMLNGFWDVLEKEAETIWGWCQKFSELDQDKHADGNELDEFWSHKFLESLGETMTVIEMREKFRKIDADFNKRMSMVEYIMFRYGFSIPSVLTAPQGDNTEGIKRAEAMVSAAQTAVDEMTAKLAESTAAAERAKKAADSAKQAADAAKETAEASARAAKAVADAEAEAKAALAELQAEEKAFEDKKAGLEKTKNDMSIGVVKRNKAANELDQLLSEDPLPLRKAKINQSAAVKKCERATKAAEIAKAKADADAAAAEEASQKAAAAEREAVAAEEEAQKSVAEAERKLQEALDCLEAEKHKGGVAQGDIWWMQREITEKKKYLPASKQK